MQNLDGDPRLKPEALSWVLAGYNLRLCDSNTLTPVMSADPCQEHPKAVKTSTEARHPKRCKHHSGTGIPSQNNVGQWSMFLAKTKAAGRICTAQQREPDYSRRTCTKCGRKTIRTPKFAWQCGSSTSSNCAEVQNHLEWQGSGHERQGGGCWRPSKTQPQQAERDFV